ncbi:MAG TPA: DinB family protein, partial [Candidatus Hodarchaeales archaeon]|nr:DinB family protein [Candidatus Hodarchaeales archaeon]
MNIQDIQLIYDYNYWASGKILAASAKVTQEQFLAPADFPFGGLRGTLLHIVDAEYGWRDLFETNKFGEDLKTEDFPTLRSLEEKFHSEEKSLRAYLNRLK